MPQNADIRKRIETIRMERKLTQEQLAAIAGVSKGTVSRWESGEIKTLRVDKIKKIADACGYNPLWIMGLNVGKAPQSDSTREKIDLIYEKLTAMSEEEVIKVLKFIEEFL